MLEAIKWRKDERTICEAQPPVHRSSVTMSAVQRTEFACVYCSVAVTGVSAHVVMLAVVVVDRGVVVVTTAVFARVYKTICA